MPEERRQQRYEVRRITNLNTKESEFVSGWDSYQIAKGEADRLFRKTQVFHWVRDTQEDGQEKQTMTIEEARRKANEECVRERRAIYIFQKINSDDHFTSSSPSMTGGIKLERWEYGDLCEIYQQPKQ